MVKTDKGLGIVPSNVSWRFDTVLVYMLDDNFKIALDQFGKKEKHVLYKKFVEQVKLIEIE